jgi:hypothetical protein
MTLRSSAGTARAIARSLLVYQWRLEAGIGAGIRRKHAITGGLNKQLTLSI